MTTADLENGAPTLHTDRDLIAGHYRAHTRIGHGRLGEIFTAIDERDEEPGVEPHLAIQTIPESVVRNNKLFNQINLGYTILQAAAHPNIVNFLHYGRNGKSGFLVMELLEGLSLRLVLEDAGTLPLDETKPVICGVGEALRLLHAKDIVHGNLTTANVFITEELEVRLLDVVPIDSAEPLIRSTSTSEQFSCRTIEDDVFGLACLAYEMLAGRHPFNDNPPAEARLAGLEPDRIASLTNSEWNALRRALSFDREQRTSSIEDFMRDFGITGTERLRLAVDQPARHESIECPAVTEAPPMTQPAAPAQSAATAAPVATVDSVPSTEKRPPDSSPIHKRTLPLRAVFLAILLAALSAWSFYGQPQEQVESLIGYIDANLDVLRTSRSDGTVKSPTPDPADSVSTDRIAPVDYPAATAIAASEKDTLADSEANRSEPERVAAIDAVVSADSDVEPMPMERKVGFADSVVSVPERDGAARIGLVGTEYAAMPLIWWTSEYSASADTDFISVEQQTVADVSIENSNMLYVPLVNDNLPEPPESFFVNLGLHNTQQGQIERIDTVRVDIIDDD